MMSSRTLFIVYAVALTVGTHWPRLALGGGGEHGPDKMLHFAAFGMLTLLLWHTRWLSKRWQVTLAALLWTALDEYSQNISAVEREASWADFTAGAAGVLTAGIWLWALRPMGGPLNRLRLERQQLASDTVLRSWRGIISLACGAAIGGMLGFLAVLFIIMLGSETMPDTFLLTMLIAAAGGAHWVYVMLLRRANATIGERSLCLGCARSVNNLRDVDGEGRGACEHCSRSYCLGQWLPALSLPNERFMRLLPRPIVVAFCVLVLGGLLFVSLFLAARASTLFHSMARELRVELLLVIDSAFVFSAIAVGVSVFRKRLAREHDRSDMICLQCSHDLRATHTVQSIGTCGECGTQFVRLPMSMTHIS